MTNLECLVSNIIAHGNQEIATKQIMAFFKMEKEGDDKCIKCGGMNLTSYGSFMQTDGTGGNQYQCDDCGTAFDFNQFYQLDDDFNLLNQEELVTPLYDEGFEFDLHGIKVKVEKAIYLSNTEINYYCSDKEYWFEDEISKLLKKKIYDPI